jgi:hypothetical protein
MDVKIPAQIGLSPLVVKFGLVWPKLADFVAIGQKNKKKNLSETCTAVYTHISVESYSII